MVQARRRKIKVNYNRPAVFDYQRRFMDCRERFAVIEASTKVGKTAAMIIWLFEQALAGGEGHNFWWVAPFYGQAKIAFRRMKLHINNPRFFKANESELTLTLPNGAMIVFKTAEKPDNLYGDDVYAAVFDEFTRAREEAWFALRSTLTSTGGKCKFIGNVRGRGWGYKLAQRAKNGGDGSYAYFKITCWDAVMTGGLSPEEVKGNRDQIIGSSDSPEDVKRGREIYDRLLNYAYAPVRRTDTKKRLKLSEILQAKRDFPDHIFRELYEAEPSDDGGNPFGMQHLDRAKRPTIARGPAISLGADLAKSIDWTVIIGLNSEKSVCYFDRFKKDWTLVRETLEKLPDIPLAIDSTGVGDPVVEDVQKKRKHTVGFKFTYSSKQQLLEGLASAFHRGEITFPEGGPLEDELYSFEYNYTRTGVRYSAPEGLHDDCVMALALAYHQFRNRPAAKKPGKVRRPKFKGSAI